MVETPSSLYSCALCLEICSNAIETGCCHQLFCEACSTSLKTCPMCRYEPVEIIPSFIARRFIGALPIICVCGYKTTRSDLKTHELNCPTKPLKCTQPRCEFTGPRVQFLEHVTKVHSIEAIKLFTVPPGKPVHLDRDCIGKKGIAVIGSTGKYYCGSIINPPCDCCDGHCGPGNGCNCESCMKLDIEARVLPPYHLVNSKGRISRRGRAGTWHCGKPPCGPSTGAQCHACQALQMQEATSYRNIVNSWGSI